ncbi:FAD:protein FMN transferase [Methyloversatilis thermotolerans]|uniref:FAD:protein FMN transferase n=1 Tax=Methyloversatilis thermotolerans TaxID=1346290 RepID=UPI000475D6D9|nr:FAD:protein FMN transferase [Methyloversatilis thermotolerans]
MAAEPVLIHEHFFAAMGSPCELRIFLQDGARAAALIAAVTAEVARLEQRYSRYRPDSLLSQINAVAARGGRIEVDEETALLFDYADTCHRQSDGLFDVTSGVLREAWRLRDGSPPDPQVIDRLRARVGWHRVDWMRPQIGFPAGMEIDFGGIVKEYAVDRCTALCLDAGVRHGLINLGGDLRVMGPQPDGQPWQIGIQHPRTAGEVAGVLSLSRGAVATSGDYARCKVIDGRRYGHILDPRTGWPVSVLASVTVVADFCLVAGSASTIAMLKQHGGADWLVGLGLPHLWVDVEGGCGGSLLGVR